MGAWAQEPWAFGAEVKERVRQHILRRYQLLPYLEELAVQAHETGQPILRPLFYEFPEDAESALHEDQAMFGGEIMIAPITRPGHRQRQVYFPPGTWYDFWSDEFVEGPTFRNWPAPLGQMPTFLRGGRAIPLHSPRMSTQHPVEKRIWWVFPEEGSGAARGHGRDISWLAQDVRFTEEEGWEVVVRRKGQRTDRQGSVI